MGLEREKGGDRGQRERKTGRKRDKGGGEWREEGRVREIVSDGYYSITILDL